jgi:hypothetical protein
MTRMNPCACRFVAGYADQAVAALARNPDGTLDFVDFVKNGERILSSFSDKLRGPKNASVAWGEVILCLHSSRFTTLFAKTYLSLP